MGTISTVVLILILLAIIYVIQQSLRLAAYRFYPLVLIGLLLAGVFWLTSPREATNTFLNIGHYLEWVVNSTTSEACRQGVGFLCR